MKKELSVFVDEGRFGPIWKITNGHNGEVVATINTYADIDHQKMAFMLASAQKLHDLLCENLQAWDGEEESVREEHSDLIEETRTALERIKG